MMKLIWAAMMVGAAASDLPVYCRLLSVGLEAATFKPIIKGVNMSVVQHVSLLGDIDVSVSHLEIGSVKMVACGASVDSKGRFNVGIGHLDIELKELRWSYNQRSWPHTTDHGNAVGKTSVSFNMTVNAPDDEDHFFNFDLNQIDINMGAERHTWLMAALQKLTTIARPMLNAVLHHEAKTVFDQALDMIHKEGGCTFLQNALDTIEFVKFKFAMDEPQMVHVPLVGSVEISVNSTEVHQPTTMDCEHVDFTGQMLTAHILNVPFSAGFKWSYHVKGSHYFHNRGNGTTSVVAGTMVHIDLLKPTDTTMKVDLPVLKLHIDAESHAWLYDALTSVMTPLIRESLQLFGGKFMAHEIDKCLEDPKCPNLPKLWQAFQLRQALMQKAKKAASVAIVV